MDAALKLFDLTTRDLVMIPLGALFFLVLWVFLSKFLFKPYLALVEARESATSGAVESSREKVAKAAELRASYDERLGAERVTAMKQKLDVVANAKKNAAEIIERAESSAQAALRDGRAANARDAAALRDMSLQDVDGLADMVISKVTSGTSAGVH
jgi:F-type H+-transporting ATPase subunit b